MRYGYQASPGGYPVTGDGRPGIVLAASVLAYAVGGLLIISGLLLLLGASVVHAISSGYQTSDNGISAGLTLGGVANLVSAGLLIAGGVALTLRKPGGRVLMSTGATICVVAGLVWLAGGANAAWGLLVFVVPTVVGLVMAWQTSVTTWLQNQPPGPHGPERPDASAV